MTGNGTDQTGEQLNLRSRMSDLVQLHPWIEGLATRHRIPASTQFAMDLCLEEALSNIIRHGYAGDPNQSIGIQFTSPREDYYVLVIEDGAPCFNPVDAPALPALTSLNETPIGGQGIRLLRRFADALEYQAMPAGNRLTIGFSATGSAIIKD